MTRCKKLILSLGLLLASVVGMQAAPAGAQAPGLFPTAIILDWSPDLTGSTQTITISAFVYGVDPVLGGVPSGQVEFYLAGASLGVASLQPASGYAFATYTVRTFGDVPAVTARYLGDAYFIPCNSGPPNL